MDQIHNEIAIADKIMSLESDRNQQSNSDSLESESSTIQFGNPNGLNLVICKDEA